MADPKSLDEALAIFQADPPTLVKDKKGQVGNQKTKYADLVQVNAVVLSALNKLGVVYKTKPTLRAEDPKFVLAYELKHVPSDTKETGEYPLKLSENPQQMGSAISYARRYVLLALTGVAAEDEDDDGQTASGRYAQRQQRQSAPAEGGQTAQRAQRPASRSAQPPLPGEQPAGRSAGGGITDAQQRKLHASLRDAGKADRDEALAYISDVIGRDITSTRELTTAEASRVIDSFAKQEVPS